MRSSSCRNRTGGSGSKSEEAGVVPRMRCVVAAGKFWPLSDVKTKSPPPRERERGGYRGEPNAVSEPHFRGAWVAPAQPSIAAWISDALIPKPIPTSLAPNPFAHRPFVPADFASAQLPTHFKVFRASRVLCGQLTNSHYGRGRTWKKSANRPPPPGCALRCKDQPIRRPAQTRGRRTAGDETLTASPRMPGRDPVETKFPGIRRLAKGVAPCSATRHSEVTQPTRRVLRDPRFKSVAVFKVRSFTVSFLEPLVSSWF